jgi:hypothetical protein
MVCIVDRHNRQPYRDHWTMAADYSTLPFPYLWFVSETVSMSVKILVFLHGTTIMHEHAKGLARERIVQQLTEGDTSIHDYASYIPAGNAARKLQGWKRQGARICYLSSHRNAKDVETDKSVLKKHAFPDGQIFYRRNREEYKDVVERIRPLPDLIIEDDCESIGGEVEMVYPNLKPELKNRIKSIVVKEFGGIDHIPDKVSELHKIGFKEGNKTD